MDSLRPLDIVERYLAAIEAREFEVARGYLADEGFVYRSPLGIQEDADAFIADVSRVGPIMKAIERHKTFVDGDDVCLIISFRSTIEELAHIRLAQWVRVQGTRIRCIEVFFDARAYTRMFEPYDCDDAEPSS